MLEFFEASNPKQCKNVIICRLEGVGGGRKIVGDHWIFRMTERGSIITESPKGRVIECHMLIKTWSTAILYSS